MGHWHGGKLMGVTFDPGMLGGGAAAGTGTVSFSGDTLTAAGSLALNGLNSGYDVSINANMLVYGAGGSYQVILNSSGLLKIGSDTTMQRAAANVLQTPGAWAFAEMTAPTAIAATAILFCEDNGSGKTRLVARFPTGADVVLGTEA